MFLHHNYNDGVFYYIYYTNNNLFMNAVTMPWSKLEDVEIVKAILANKIDTLTLPGRTSKQIKYRRRTSMLKYESGFLVAYFPKKEVEKIKRQKEPIPDFDRPQHYKISLQSRAKQLYSKLDDVNPLDSKFNELVTELNAVEIQLESFYFNLKTPGRHNQK
ncbi:MAG: hypothetical protein Q8T08_11785 [Ignavibacteria bacterium]|nr:hypothetical protein [Ignavibacteria bacterium]